MMSRENNLNTNILELKLKLTYFDIRNLDMNDGKFAR